MTYEVVMDARVVQAPVERDGKDCKTMISCKRRSGVWDNFELLYSDAELHEGDYVQLRGVCKSCLRKHTSYVDKGIIVSDNIEVLSEEPDDYKNEVYITNAKVLKVQEYRKSYDGTGRSILTLTVSSLQTKVLRLTAWGGLADELNELVVEGSVMDFKGRLQEYTRGKSTKPRYGVVLYHAFVYKDEKD